MTATDALTQIVRLEEERSRLMARSGDLSPVELHRCFTQIPEELARLWAKRRAAQCAAAAGASGPGRV